MKTSNIWSDKMKNAHKMASRLCANGKTYRENLSTSIKVQHMLERVITIADINFLMNELGGYWVNLHIQHMDKDGKFEMTGGISSIDVYHYVAPRTQEQDEIAIGVMIEAEKRIGNKINLD